MTDNRHYHIHGGKDFLEWLWEQIGGTHTVNNFDRILQAIAALDAKVTLLQTSLAGDKSDIAAIKAELDTIRNDLEVPGVTNITVEHSEPKPNV